jgi:hypothetical protein
MRTGALAEVAALLDAECLPYAGLRVAGHENEIVIVEAEPSLAKRLAELGEAIRARGFRYITIDLGIAEVS